MSIYFTISPLLPCRAGVHLAAQGPLEGRRPQQARAHRRDGTVSPHPLVSSAHARSPANGRVCAPCADPAADYVTRVAPPHSCRGGRRGSSSQAWRRPPMPCRTPARCVSLLAQPPAARCDECSPLYTAIPLFITAILRRHGRRGAASGHSSRCIKTARAGGSRSRLSAPPVARRRGDALHPYILTPLLGSSQTPSRAACCCRDAARGRGRLSPSSWARRRPTARATRPIRTIR